MKPWVWIGVVLLFIGHQDVWLWADADLWLGPLWRCLTREMLPNPRFRPVRVEMSSHRAVTGRPLSV